MDSGAHGILLIDKPAGISSAAAIAKVKRRLGLKKIGHAGTLDPFATGLLICVVNGATRFACYAEAGDKSYEGTFRLGLTSDTDDITGRVLTRSSVSADYAAVCCVAREFIGESYQTPPDYSALKIGGEPAYEKARRGEKIELPARKVSIESLHIGEHNGDDFFYRVKCSKGTYVRALFRDIGAKLGCGAVVTSLRRTASAPFCISQANGVEEVAMADLLPWTELFPGACHVHVEKNEITRLRAGDQAALSAIVARHAQAHSKNSECCSGNIVYRQLENDTALGLFVRDNGRWCFAVNLA